MSDKDSITKQYMQDNAIFADLFNFFMYDGRQVIKPENLQPVDTASIVFPYGDDNKYIPVQKYRDVLKMVTIKRDDKATYLVLGIENQSDIHYAMPVRNMLYDAMQYTSQIEQISKSHRKENSVSEKITKSEFLSGFYKTDKILPVITVTVYFGSGEWTAPKSLYEMLDVQDENILKYVSDYQLNLITPFGIDDDEFAKLQTELGAVLKYVKNSASKEKLDYMIHSDEAYRNISHRSAELLRIVTNSKLKFKGRKGNVDMCKAIEEMRADAKAEGKAEGIAEGKAEGIAEGKAEGKAEGIAQGIAEGKAIGMIEGIISTLASLVRDGVLTAVEAAKRAGMSVADFEAKAGLKA